jgi:hypothetical protein
VITVLVTMSFSFDDEPRVNSQDELAVATSGSVNLKCRSNCNLRVCDRGCRKDAVR